MAQQMASSTGMTVLVENKAGGNFIPALMEVARSTPDGHTLYFSSTSSLITQTLFPDYPYDLRKFTAVSEVATGPLILVVRNDLGVKTIQELIALAKQKPGAIRFGLGGGVGSSLGVSTVLLQSLAGIKVNMVPYRGAAPALTDMLGGHIDAMIDAMPVMAVQAKEGKVTPLAVTGTKRSALLPDVPTMQESGFPTFVVTGWYGIFGPPGMPQPIAQKLRDEAAKALQPKEVIDTLAKQGMEPRGTQPAEYASTWSRSSRSIPRSSRTPRSSRRSNGNASRSVAAGLVPAARVCLIADASSPSVKERKCPLAAPGSITSATTSCGRTRPSSSRAWRPTAPSRWRKSTRCCEKLRARQGEADRGKAWFEEWRALGDLIEKRGDEALSKGRKVTAGDYYLRAGIYHYNAERFIAPSPEKKAQCAHAYKVWHQGIRLRYPQIEFIEVPYEGTTLPALFMPGQGNGPKPTVVVLNGMDNARR